MSFLTYLGFLPLIFDVVPSGKSEKITITNENQRLSQRDIDRMVAEAEEFAAEVSATLSYRQMDYALTSPPG